MLFWGLSMGLPVLALGIGMALAPERTRCLMAAGVKCRPLAFVLTAAAWLWTAYECDILGIEAFDRFTKMFPGELWILAAVLTYLVFIWMPANLVVRATAGLLMLLPAEMFKTMRPLLPEGGADWVHVFAVAGYLAAILGMYAMFYPWRVERAVRRFCDSSVRMRAAGVVLVVLGVTLAITGVVR